MPETQNDIKPTEQNVPVFEIRQATKATTRRVLATFPWVVYKRNSNWVPPLLAEVLKTINPNEGAFFERGSADCFLAYQDNKPVGTICLAEDPVINEKLGEQVALFGFFETVEDYSVAEALFKQAVSWAQERSLGVLYGPFNLNYYDRYGILIDCHARPPVILSAYNPAYYQSFFVRYGFVPAYQEIALETTLNDHKLERLSRIGEKLRHRRRTIIRPVKMANWDKEREVILRLAQDVQQASPGKVPWQQFDISCVLEFLRHTADPELMLIAEVDGQPAGFLAGFPNVNEVYIHVNGLLHIWDVLRFYWNSLRAPECLAVRMLYVKPGIFSEQVVIQLADELLERARARRYRRADLSMISSDQTRIINLAQQFGATIYKTWHIYRLDL